MLEVTCTPDEQSASCVLVFRAYGNYMLNWKETFPVTVNLDPDVNYTFALFRRLDKDTDERPFLSMFVQGKEDPSQPQPPSTGNGKLIICVTKCILEGLAPTQLHKIFLQSWINTHSQSLVRVVLI